jgi:hypothetical protein
MEPLRSSNLSGVDYNADTQTLTIQFSSGALYEYAGVSQNVYEQLRSSGSPGRFFQTAIRDAYPTQRVG